MAEAEGIVLIAGLGNPGPEYLDTRHNAGFWFVDELARRYGGAFRLEHKFAGAVCRVRVAGREVWLLKPQTFMNRSGQSVRQLAAFYNLGVDNLLVAHDEIDLPAGDIRFKRGGGHGGHNGLRDIFSHLGQDFLRLRIGVGHPGSRERVVGHVLDRATVDEKRAIEAAINRATDIIPEVLEGQLEKAMHRLHSP